MPKRKNNLRTATERYKADPSIKKYLELRRAYPDQTIEFSLFSSVEAAQLLEKEYNAFGLPTEDVAGCLLGDAGSISTISKAILEAIDQRRRAEAAGQTHLGRRRMHLPDRLIQFLVCCMGPKTGREYSEGFSPELALSWSATDQRRRSISAISAGTRSPPDQCGEPIMT